MDALLWKMKIYVVVATSGRAMATPCKQSNKQPVVLFIVPAKGREQEDACKFNYSSNNRVQAIKYTCAPFSS
jgi:hypothetical protein